MSRVVGARDPGPAAGAGRTGVVERAGVTVVAGAAGDRLKHAFAGARVARVGHARVRRLRAEHLDGQRALVGHVLRVAATLVAVHVVHPDVETEVAASPTHRRVREREGERARAVLVFGVIMHDLGVVVRRAEAEAGDRWPAGMPAGIGVTEETAGVAGRRVVVRDEKTAVGAKAAVPRRVRQGETERRRGVARRGDVRRERDRPRKKSPTDRQVRRRARGPGVAIATVSREPGAGGEELRRRDVSNARRSVDVRLPRVRVRPSLVREQGDGHHEPHQQKTKPCPPTAKFHHADMQRRGRRGVNDGAFRGARARLLQPAVEPRLVRGAPRRGQKRRGFMTERGPPPAAEPPWRGQARAPRHRRARARVPGGRQLQGARTRWTTTGDPREPADDAVSVMTNAVVESDGGGIVNAQVSAVARNGVMTFRPTASAGARL